MITIRNKLGIFWISCALIVSPYAANADSFFPPNGSVFLNPAAQIGYTFSRGVFFGFQLSVNKLDYQVVNGATLGYRRYRDENNIYVDFQQSSEGVLGYGMGLNFRMHGDSMYMSHYRIKAWAGILVLATYDVMFATTKIFRTTSSVGTVATLPFRVNR